jgi:hypothetical protein
MYNDLFTIIAILILRYANRLNGLVYQVVLVAANAKRNKAKAALRLPARFFCIAIKVPATRFIYLAVSTSL